MQKIVLTSLFAPLVVSALFLSMLDCALAESPPYVQYKRVRIPSAFDSEDTRRGHFSGVALNNCDEIIGSYFNLRRPYPEQQEIWSAAVGSSGVAMTRYGTDPVFRGHATDLNDSGQVIVISGPSDNIVNSILDIRTGQISTLNISSTYGLIRINNKGHMGGWAFTGFGADALVYPSAGLEQIVHIDAIGDATVVALNEKNQALILEQDVLGGTPHSYVYDYLNGELRQVTAASSSNIVGALALSNRSVIVGAALTGENFEAFARAPQDSDIRLFTRIPGTEDSTATSVNDSNYFVGTSVNGFNTVGFISHVDDSRLRRLNELIGVDNSELRSNLAIRATAINNNGVVLVEDSIPSASFDSRFTPISLLVPQGYKLGSRCLR